MMGGSSNPRLQGVRGNQKMGLGTLGPPKTVIGVAPLTFHMVGFHDETGAFTQAVVVRVGDQLYFPQNSVEWANSMRKAAPWLKEQFDRKSPAGTAELVTNEALPATDPVDVVGEGNDPPAT